MADSTPDWADEIRSLYLSGASNQFVVHGNVSDRLLIDEEGKGARLGNMPVFGRGGRGMLRTSTR